jgi:hypothetical protein
LTQKNNRKLLFGNWNCDFSLWVALIFHLKLHSRFCIRKCVVVHFKILCTLGKSKTIIAPKSVGTNLSYKCALLLKKFWEEKVKRTSWRLRVHTHTYKRLSIRREVENSTDVKTIKINIIDPEIIFRIDIEHVWPSNIIVGS